MSELRKTYAEDHRISGSAAMSEVRRTLKDEPGIGSVGLKREAGMKVLLNWTAEDTGREKWTSETDI